MRGLDAGESFVVTRNGVPAGQLTPMPRRAFVSKAAALTAFASAPAFDYARFRADLDATVSQQARPRA
jgi:antitoxin (DNA-binding transcriptional repressor) of toxin-antitoxin stability system